MSEFVTIKISGFKELADKLHSLGPKDERQGLRKAALTAAAIIKKAAKESTAFKDVTGELRANIIAAYRRSPPHWATYRITVRWTRYRVSRGNRLKGIAGKVREHNPAMYGKFLEFGTSKMHARPFLRPAFVNNTNEAIEAMRIPLGDAIEDAAR